MTRMMTKEEDMILAETYIIMNSIIVQYFVYIQHISSDTCSNTYHTSIYIHIQLWYLLSLGSR